MKKLAPILFFCFVSACASGPTVQESGLSSIPENKGRVVVYRTDIMATAHQPRVYVEGAKRGKCQPNGAFSVDVAPGQRTLSYLPPEAGELDNTLTVVTITEGQTTYVKCSMGMGIMFSFPRFEVVSEAVGMQETAPLAMIGKY